MSFKLLIFAIFALAPPGLHAQTLRAQGQGLTLTASDGLKISATLLPAKAAKGTLIIVAPGFSQHKDTPIMRTAALLLTSYGDVLSMDFRGTGESEGRYHFGAQEHRDIEAAFLWAKPRYRDIELIGFSMGGFISLRAAVEFPGVISRLYLVSAPSNPRDIALTLGPLRQALSLPFKPEVRAIRKWAGGSPRFRWGKIFAKRPKGQALAAALKIPVSFLVGDKDQLVLPGLSFSIYNAVPGKKIMQVLPEGHHAEYLPVMNEKEFRKWFESSRKELSAPAKLRP